MMSLLPLVEKPYKCEFCQASFIKPSTLVVHVCEKKRRHLAKNDRNVVLGFDAFNRFFQINHRNHGTQTYDSFAASPYYNAFVKFGSFINNVKPLYPDNFINYVVKSGVKLDNWCSETLYDEYVVKLVKSEAVETALERSVNHMISWSNETKNSWNSYFANVSLNRAAFDVKDGKISPWIILNSKNGKNMLRQFDDVQLTTINKIMDVQFWLIKFKRAPSDVELVKQIVAESGL